MQGSITLGSLPRDTRVVNGTTYHVVKLLFYQYGDMTQEEGANNTWNWLAACWTGGGWGVSEKRMTEEELMEAMIRGEDVPEPIFTHVELRFSDGKGTSITSKSGKIHYENRLHTRQNYSFVAEYLLTEGEERRVQSLAEDMFDQGVGFNRRGFLLNFLPIIGKLWAGEASDGSVFCTEYIVKLLHEANRLLDVDPHRTSPQQLYHIMLDEIRDGRAEHSWNKEAGIAMRDVIVASPARPLGTGGSATSKKGSSSSRLFRSVKQDSKNK